MLGLKVNEAKSQFFDRLSEVEQMIEAVSYRQAMLVKSIAQRSMRSGGKKEKASAPGEPPRTHGQRQLRVFLYGVFDRSTRSQVIGPALLNQVNIAASGLGQVSIPEILEYGGEYRAFEERYTRGNYSTEWHRVDLRRTDRKAWLRFTDAAGGRGFVADNHGIPRETRLRTIKILPRPYMNPALEKAKPRLSGMYSNQLKRAA